MSYKGSTRCSSNCCLYKSESERPSVQQIITEGSRIDKLYLGKYLPLREKKLLDKLLKTRAIYDEVVEELLSGSDFSVPKKGKLRNPQCSCGSSESFSSKRGRRHGDVPNKVIREALQKRRNERQENAPCKCDFSGCESVMRLISKTRVGQFKHSANRIKRTLDAGAKRSLNQVKKKIKKQDKKHGKHSSTSSQTHVTSSSAGVDSGKRKEQRHKALETSKQKPRLSTSKSVALPASGSKSIVRSVSADFDKNIKLTNKRKSHPTKRRSPSRCICTLDLKPKLDKKESIPSSEKPHLISKSSEMRQKQQQRKSQSNGQTLQFNSKPKTKSKATKQLPAKVSKTSQSSEEKPLFLTKIVEAKQKSDLKETQVGGGILARCFCTLKLKAKATKNLFSRETMTPYNIEERKLKDQITVTDENKKADQNIQKTEEGGRALKRCFCTLKLKANATKQILSKKSMTSQVSNRMTPKPHTKNRGNATKTQVRINKEQSAPQCSNPCDPCICPPNECYSDECLKLGKKRQGTQESLHPDMCDSGCVPYDCNPEDCLKIIIKKQGTHMEHKPKPLKPKRPQNKTVQSKVLKRAHESGDTVNKQKSISTSKTSTEISTEKRGSQGDVKSVKSLNIQIEKKNKNVRVGSALKRCFCTLKLNKIDKGNKNTVESISRGTETPPKDVKYNDTTNKNKGTKVKQKYNPKPRKRVNSLGSRLDTGTNPESVKKTVASSMTHSAIDSADNAKKNQKLRHKPMMNYTKYDDEYCFEEPQITGSRQVLRICSSISFGIEFSRDTVQNVYSVGHSEENDFFHKLSKTKGPVTKTASSTSLAIPKRCFCTLNFRKKHSYHDIAKSGTKQPRVYTVNRFAVKQSNVFNRGNRVGLKLKNKNYGDNSTECEVISVQPLLDKQHLKYNSSLHLEDINSKSITKCKKISPDLRNEEFKCSNISFRSNLYLNQALPTEAFLFQNQFYTTEISSKKAQMSSKKLISVNSSFRFDVFTTNNNSQMPDRRKGLENTPNKEKTQDTNCERLKKPHKQKDLCKTAKENDEELTEISEKTSQPKKIRSQDSTHSSSYINSKAHKKLIKQKSKRYNDILKRNETRRKISSSTTSNFNIKLSTNVISKQTKIQPASLMFTEKQLAAPQKKEYDVIHPKTNMYYLQSEVDGVTGRNQRISRKGLESVKAQRREQVPIKESKTVKNKINFYQLLLTSKNKNMTVTKNKLGKFEAPLCEKYCLTGCNNSSCAEIYRTIESASKNGIIFQNNKPIKDLKFVQQRNKSVVDYRNPTQPENTINNKTRYKQQALKIKPNLNHKLECCRVLTNGEKCQHRGGLNLENYNKNEKYKNIPKTKQHKVIMSRTDGLKKNTGFSSLFKFFFSKRENSKVATCTMTSKKTPRTKKILRTYCQDEIHVSKSKDKYQKYIRNVDSRVLIHRRQSKTTKEYINSDKRCKSNELVSHNTHQLQRSVRLYNPTMVGNKQNTRQNHNATYCFQSQTDNNKKSTRRHNFSVSDAKIKSCNLENSKIEYDIRTPNKCYSYVIDNSSKKPPSKVLYSADFKKRHVKTCHNKQNYRYNTKTSQLLIKNQHKICTSYVACSRGPCGDTNPSETKINSYSKNTFRRNQPFNIKIRDERLRPKSTKSRIKQLDNKQTIKTNPSKTKLDTAGIGYFLRRALQIFKPRKTERIPVKTTWEITDGDSKNSARDRKIYYSKPSGNNQNINRSLSRFNDSKKTTHNKYKSRSTHIAEVSQICDNKIEKKAPVHRSAVSLRHKVETSKKYTNKRNKKDLQLEKLSRDQQGDTAKPNLKKKDANRIYSFHSYKYQEHYFNDQNNIKKELANRKNLKFMTVKLNGKNESRLKSKVGSPKPPNIETSYVKNILKQLFNTFKQSKKEHTVKLNKTATKSRRVDKVIKPYHRDLIVARAAVNLNKKKFEQDRYQMKNKNKIFDLPTENAFTSLHYSKYYHGQNNLKNEKRNNSKKINTIYPNISQVSNGEFIKIRHTKQKLPKSELQTRKQKKSAGSGEKYFLSNKSKNQRKLAKSNMNKTFHNFINLFKNKPREHKSQSRHVSSNKKDKYYNKTNKYLKPATINRRDKSLKVKPKGNALKRNGHESYDYDIRSVKRHSFQNKHTRNCNITNTAPFNKSLACFYCKPEYSIEPCKCTDKKSKKKKKKGPKDGKVNKKGYENINLTQFETLPPGTTIPPYDEGSMKPLFEMRLKSGTLDLVNPDEVYGQIRKLNNLSANRLKDYLKALRKLHGEGCCCCICKAVKERVIGADIVLQEKRKRECIEKKKKELELRAKSCAEVMMQWRRKPCTCGIKPCLVAKHKMTELEILRHRGLQTKPCSCGTKICEKSWSKKLGGMKGVRASDVDRKKQQIKETKLAKKRAEEYKIRKALYDKEDKEIRKAQKLYDKQQQKRAKHSVTYGNVIIAADSVFDISRTIFKNAYNGIACFFKKIFSPVKAAKSIRYRTTDPGPRITKELGNIWIQSGIEGTAKRTCYRAGEMPCINKLVDKLQTTTPGVYVTTMLEPKKRKRLIEKIEQRQRAEDRKGENVDFQCSLFMASLRKRPFLKVYYTCPWFYPHCISLLGVLRTITEALLFCLAVLAWSPCILAMEICRAMMCCTACTG